MQDPTLEPQQLDVAQPQLEVFLRHLSFESLENLLPQRAGIVGSHGSANCAGKSGLAFSRG